MHEFTVSLADGRDVVVYANNPEHAITVAADEFGMSASNPREPVAEISEYFSEGRTVYARYDDDTEQLVMAAETPEHAAQKAAGLNAAL